MYSQLEAKLHDLFWASEGAPAELPIMRRFLEMHPGTSLELGAGSGRLLLPLVRDGFFVEGLDSSEEMLELCRKSPGGEDVILHLSGMEDFDTGATYSAITIPAFTLQLVPFERVPDVLECVARHLHPGGGFYLSIFVPWAEITGEFEEGAWYLDRETKMDDGQVARCFTKFEIKRLSQQLIREHRYEIVSEKGKVVESSTSTHELTWFWPRELTMMLHHAGFTVDQFVSDFDLDSDFDDNGHIVTVLAHYGEEEAFCDEENS